MMTCFLFRAVLLVTFLFASLAQLGHAMTVAEARALGAASNVVIGPITLSTVQDITGSGYACAAQDGTGGITLYGTTAQALITSSNFVAGDSITISGSNVFYRGLYELMNIQLVTYHGFVGVPAPLPVDVTDLIDGAPTGLIAQSKLVLLSDVTFVNAGQVFASAVNYPVTRNSITNIVRVQDSADPLVNKLIPYGSVSITGILSQFDSTAPYDGGFQLLPLGIVTPVIPIDPFCYVDMTNLNYGMVYSNQWRTLSFALKNAGTHSNLTVNTIAPAGGDTGVFAVTTLGFPMTLTPGSNVYVYLRYYGAPTGAVHSAVFAVQSNDPSNAVQHVTVNGVVADYPVGQVRINEINNAVPSPYQDEYLEICGPAGTDISGWQLQFYFRNANGTVSNFANHTITNFVLPNDDSGMGYYVMVCSDYSSPKPSWVDDIANFDRFLSAAGVYVASARLLDTNGHQVHFFEYDSDNCSQYGFAWPDDLTYRYDSTSENLSLSLSNDFGFNRTFMSWQVMIKTPGAVNTIPEPAVLFAAAWGMCTLLRRARGRR
jgi:DNA/RNA endonuclease YhcR with UshA esterase domain